MLIQEEYARRHGLSLALANHTLREGICLLRATSGGSSFGVTRHLVMNVKWVPHDRRPGSYHVSFTKPVHDSHNQRGNFALIAEPQSISYEDFDMALRNTRKTTLPGYEAVLESRAAGLFLWEAFLCCYDGWLLRNATSRMMTHIEASIDPDLPEDVRYENYDSAALLISMEHPVVYEKWNVCFASQRTKVLPWLGKMFNGE